VIATKVAKQLLRGLRHRRPINSGVRILTYHGVVEEYVDKRVDESFHLLRDFRSHIDLLRRCHVVPLAELDETLKRRTLRPRVAITFDDGFANNTIAAELLRAARLPATFFVASGNVETGEPIWPTVLRLVLARGAARRLEIDGSRYDLDGDPSAIANVRKLFKRQLVSRRRTLWAELIAQQPVNELDRLLADVPTIRMMTWKDVSALHASGFEIGSHGSFHELHHEQQAPDSKDRELRDSRLTIERQLGTTCERFAFPNGSYSEASPAELRAAGYAAGFTMVSRAATAADDRMLLPRIVPGAGAEKVISSLFFGN